MIFLGRFSPTVLQLVFIPFSALFFVLNYPPKNLLSQLLSFPPTRKFLVCTLIMICFKQKIMIAFKIHQLIFCHLFCHFCFALCKKTSNEKRIEFSMGVHQNTFCIFTMFENLPELSYLNFRAKKWPTYCYTCKMQKIK